MGTTSIVLQIRLAGRDDDSSCRDSRPKLLVCNCCANASSCFSLALTGSTNLNVLEAYVKSTVSPLRARPFDISSMYPSFKFAVLVKNESTSSLDLALSGILQYRWGARVAGRRLCMRRLSLQRLPFEQCVLGAGIPKHFSGFVQVN